MFRTQRDTGKWFNNDDKGQLKDKRYIKAMAPGVYNPDRQPLADKKQKISWNFGQVPFGTCNERFKSEMRTLPGPGSYEQNVLQLTKPMVIKRQSPSPRTSPQMGKSPSRSMVLKSPLLNSAGDISLDATKMNLSRKAQMNQTLKDNQQSWAFKSKEPKVGIYRDEEKRIKLLYGSRQGLKYKIKLNDQILDPAQSSQSPVSKGKLALGKTIEANQLMQINIKKMNEKKQKEDIFGTQQKLPLGPGDYEAKINLTKNQSPTLKFQGKKAEEEPGEERTIQKQFKQIRMFDGSASTIKKVPKPIKCAPLEERQIVEDFAEVQTGAKAEAVFNSKTDRFRSNTYLNQNNNPGPQDYEAHSKGPQYIIKGPVDTSFGTVAERNSLLQRDVSKSPFKNPTRLENPAPSQYAPRTHEMSKEFSPRAQSINVAHQTSTQFINQQSSGHLNELSVDEMSRSRAQPTFTSVVQRDFLESVSKEIRQNPGPGSYLHDQLMKDKMRALSFQVCQRYQMNPFGTGNPRFNYQKTSKKNELSTDMNNGMISVKDKDVMEKRFAFQKTIELHKKMQDLQPNAIFKSQIERDCSPQKKADAVKAGTQDFDRSAYQTGQTMRTTMNKGAYTTGNTMNDRSSLGLFHETHSPYETGNSTRQGQDNGYNMLLSEHLSKPGFNATQPRFNYMKDEIKRSEVPGPGSYARFNTQEGPQRSSPRKLDGTAIFKDATGRDDHKSYLAHEKKKPQVAPSEYFQETRPFLKKTFNASLPPPRFI